MPMNLQEMTERVAEFVNADKVDSINDTDESFKIATIIKETFEEMVLSKEIQTALELFKLQSSSNEAAKTCLIIPEEALTLDIVKYTHKDGKIYSPEYMEPMEFIEWTLGYDITEDEVETVTDTETGAVYNIRTDKDPSFYTIISGKYLIFDSYNSEFENTLQGRHCICYGHTLPAFEMKDEFVPDLQEQQFPILLSRAKTAADMELRGNLNQIEYDKGKKLFINTTNNSKSYTRGNTRWNNRIKFRV